MPPKKCSEKIAFTMTCRNATRRFYKKCVSGIKICNGTMEIGGDVFVFLSPVTGLWVFLWAWVQGFHPWLLTVAPPAQGTAWAKLGVDVLGDMEAGLSRLRVLRAAVDPHLKVGDNDIWNAAEAAWGGQRDFRELVFAVMRGCCVSSRLGDLWGGGPRALP